MSSPLNIAVFISGKGSNLQAIIDAIEAGLNANIALVISNRENAFGLTRAIQAGIPTRVVTRKQYPDATDYDQAVLTELQQAEVELVVLAGFMRIISPMLTTAFLGKMINIHPSLLPKYRGLDTHQRVLDAGDEQHGISVHYVSDELDGGPIIARCSFAVAPDDDAVSLQQKGHAIEHKLYPTVIHWIASGRLHLEGNEVILDNSPLPSHGYEFNCEQDYEISEKAL